MNRIKKVVLGVDGGNTKTDYLIFSSEGEFIDHLRAGSCSHEALDDGYDGAEREMRDRCNELLSRNNYSISDVGAAAFGLAGVDFSSQQKRLTDILTGIGFQNFVAVNDSFLGVKGMCSKGYGVCSINGTGTTAGGIDRLGNMLQVDGVGPMSGSRAGGPYLARRAVRAVYDSIFRCGVATSMTLPMFKLFDVDINDKINFIEAAIEKLGTTVPVLEPIKIIMAASKDGDEAACKVIKDIAYELAYSAAGCVNLLDFDDVVDIVIAGSVWTKGDAPLMHQEFLSKLEELTGKSCHIIKMEVPPATGAVLWALELLCGSVPEGDLRNRVLESVARL